jgi:hypothetical protein
VTDRATLGRAGVALRDRLVRAHELRGVSFLLPETTWLDVDVRIGRDTVIYPGCILEGATEIGDECVIGPHSRVIDATIGRGVELRGWNYLCRTHVRNPRRARAVRPAGGRVTARAAPPEAPELPPWAQVGEKRRAHIARVTALLRTWADRLARDADEALAMRDAGLLHDALRDAPESLLRELTGDTTSPVDLLHGRPRRWCSRDRARRARRSSPRALAHHRLGGVGPRGTRAVHGRLPRAGRKFAAADRAFLAEHALHDFDGVFRQVVRMRLEWSLREGQELFPTAVALWNQVR